MEVALHCLKSKKLVVQHVILHFPGGAKFRFIQGPPYYPMLQTITCLQSRFSLPGMPGLPGMVFGKYQGTYLWYKKSSFHDWKSTKGVPFSEFQCLEWYFGSNTALAQACLSMLPLFLLLWLVALGGYQLIIKYVRNFFSTSKSRTFFMFSII